MRSNLEEYKGKKVFIARYDHLSSDGVKTEIEEVKEYMATISEGSARVLVDTTGTLISPEVLNQFKQISSQASQKISTKTAILGMSGPRKTFLDIVSKFSKNKTIAFDTKDEAMEWLVS